MALDLKIGKPAVGSALGIARGMREKKEQEKKEKQAILRQSQERNRERRDLLEAEKKAQQVRDKETAWAGSRGEIGKKKDTQ
jgi:hypothetical protein